MRLFLRLLWATAAVVVWPLYYAALLLRWIVPWRIAPLERAYRFDPRLSQALRAPPFIERLRG